MLLRLVFLLPFCVILINCARYTQDLRSTEVKVIHNVALFKDLFIQGDVNVVLHTGYATPKVLIKGLDNDLEKIKINVVKQKLYISYHNQHLFKHQIYVEIFGVNLKNFTYQGRGDIIGNNLKTDFVTFTINNPGHTTLGGNIGLHKLELAGGGVIVLNGIHSQNLIVSLKDKTKLHLHGIINLANLIATGKGYVNMYWIKSSDLKVVAKNKILLQLAGVVDFLEVEVFDKAIFNGRFLRAKKSFIRTHDKSLAEINTLERQHALAKDASDIYFYNLPPIKTDLMQTDGAVLDMREWYPLEGDFGETNYNK